MPSPASEPADILPEQVMEAARSARGGDLREGSQVTGLDEQVLKTLADSIGDFSIENEDLREFSTDPPIIAEQGVDEKVSEFLKRSVRYPLLDGNERQAFKALITRKMTLAETVLDHELENIARGRGILLAEVKGVFVVHDWLWYDLESRPTHLKQETPTLLELILVVDNMHINHGEITAIDTGLGPRRVLVSIVRENDFLDARNDFAYLKLIAYRGIQVRGSPYFAGQPATPEHLIVYANIKLGTFLTELMTGRESGQSVARLQEPLYEAETVFQYLSSLNRGRKIDFGMIWDVLQRNEIYPDELEPMRLRLVRELFYTKGVIQDGHLAQKIQSLLESSL